MELGIQNCDRLIAKTSSFVAEKCLLSKLNIDVI
jgi:hypothetical protein